MKKILIILLCSFIASCASSAEKDLNNPTQVIIEEILITQTKTPEPTNTPTITITPTITVTPKPQSLKIGDDNGALSFMEGSHLNISDINGHDLTLVNPGIVRLSKYAALPFRWSIDERYITYMTGLGDHSFLRLVDVHSSEVKDISLPSITSGSFSWHPAGEKFAVSPSSGSYIWIINLEDATPQKIDIDIETERIFDLNWSPDGQKISLNYSVPRDEATRTIYPAVIDINGDILFQPDYSGADIIWSPQENKIGLIRAQSFEILDLDTKEKINIISLPYQGQKSEAIDSVTWSPDGNHIAYEIGNIVYNTADWLPISSIHVYNIAEGQDFQITEMNENYDNIIWSPDGKHLAYSVCGDNQCSIQRVDIDGNNKFEIISDLGPEVSSLHWISSPVFLHHSLSVDTNSTIPTPPIYDDFENSQFNQNLWSLSNSESLNYFTYEPVNGSLEISSKGEIESQDISLRLNGSRSISSVEAFEAKLRIDDNSHGEFTLVKTFVDVFSGSFSFSTACFLENNLESPRYFCNVAHTNDGYKPVYGTDTIPININQWYEVRIEFRSDTGFVHYYLDGDIVGIFGYEADNILYEDAIFEPGIGIWVGNGYILSSFDDVRITE